MRFHGRMPEKPRLAIRTLCGLALVAAFFKFLSVTPLSLIATEQLAAARQSVLAQKDSLVPRFGTHQPTAIRSPQAVAAAVLARQPTSRPAAPETSRPVVLRILTAAAKRHQLDPKLVLALSFWESGWDQSRVSSTGAVGLMQVEPPTAAEAGPALLGRSVDINDPRDNADVGAAILRQNLDTFHDETLALAAYYEGPNALRANGLQPDAQQYAQGILSLSARLTA